MPSVSCVQASRCIPINISFKEQKLSFWPASSAKVVAFGKMPSVFSSRALKALER